MSLQLRLARLAARLLIRPRLARTTRPERARRDLNLGARLLRAPPFQLRLERPGRLHHITAGPVHGNAVILWLHGGAYVAGSPCTHAAMLGSLARLSGLEVVAPDYRLAPEHPAPAAFDDARAAHADLLAAGWRPDQIVLGGDSAGGGLALALLADLCQRDLRPAGLLAFSPWTDLTLSADSLRDCSASDPLLPVSRITTTVALVLGALAPEDPRISPLFASFPAPPPVLIQSSADEILRDDSRRMVAHLRAAGGQVTLQEHPAALHVWQMLDGYLPEARQALHKAAEFCRAQAGTPEISR